MDAHLAEGVVQDDLAWLRADVDRFIEMHRERLGT
jgi:hypothetical protein